jgi:hypothetical protein
MRRGLVPLLGIILANGLAAQQASVSGPVEGYTFDAPTRSLRAVIGFPGSASFGPVLRESLDFASIAPRQNYGITFQRGECILIAGLGSAQVSTRAFPALELQPDGIVWSGDGSRAVLFSIGGNWLQTVSGFPTAPSAQSRRDLSSLGGLLLSVAVDANGTHIAVGLAGSAAAAYVSTDGETFDVLGSVAKPTALSFSSDGGVLYVLDAGARQIVAINTASHGIQSIPLSGLAEPIAIQAVQDSQKHQQLYVASASDRLLRIIDVASQQTVTDVQLGFEPTRLDLFGSGSFVAASRSQAAKPLWLFTSAPVPAAYFVPAVQVRPPNHHLSRIPEGAR